MSLLQNEDFKTEAQITGAGGTASQLLNDTKIWVSANSINKTLDDAIVDGDLGGGGGGELDINYITNYDFETDVSGYSRYADVAGVNPVDATGGAPNAAFTFTRNTTNPLFGTGDGLITKDANDRQGHGVSIDTITIDKGMQGRMSQFRFFYKTSSAYNDGDVRIGLVDVTNSVLLEPSQRDLLANTVNGEYIGYVQIPSNCTQVRPYFHISSSNASAYTINVDVVTLGVISKGNAGTFVSDWQSFTPTGSWSTNTTYAGKYRRVGDSLELDVYISLAGAPTSASLTLNMPSGYTIDLTKLSSGNNNLQVVGMASCRDASTDSYEAIVAIGGSTTLSIFKDDGDGTYSAVTQAAPFTFGSTDYISIRASGIPISGWSTGVSASEISSTTAIAFRAYRSGSQSISSTSYTKVAYNSVDGTYGTFNVGGAFDTTNNWFLAPESGVYMFGAAIQFNGDLTSEEEHYLDFRVNGTSNYVSRNTITSVNAQIYSDVLLKLNKGDYVEVYVKSTSDASYSIGSDRTTMFYGHKVNNPAQIAPTEFVGCAYGTNAGQSFSNNTETTVLFEDKIFDSHAGMDTGNGKYTISTSGKYFITAMGLFNSNTGWSVTEYVQNALYKNSAVLLARTYNNSWVTTASGMYAMASLVTYLGDFVKGDTIYCTFIQNSGGTIGLATDSSLNQISIQKVG